MNFPFFIAKRYFSTKKNSNFVHIISWVALLGVAIGTAALILVLSVFNGFEDLLLSMYNSFDPHIKITSNEGKSFQSKELISIPGTRFEQLRRGVVGMRPASLPVFGCS